MPAEVKKRGIRNWMSLFFASSVAIGESQLHRILVEGGHRGLPLKSRKSEQKLPDNPDFRQCLPVYISETQRGRFRDKMTQLQRLFFERKVDLQALPEIRIFGKSGSGYSGV